MHQTRKTTSTKLPIQRKGTKYVIRSSSHSNDSVPILIALREMLQVAKTAKEAKHILLEKNIKINGRISTQLADSIKLFNILETGKKTYRLSLLPIKKFFLEEIKSSDTRLCKVIDKRLVADGKIQLSFHDGSNILTDEKVNTHDSVYLDFSGKIKKKISLIEGGNVMVISGKHLGKSGKIEKIEDNQITIKFQEGSADIDRRNVIAL